MAEQVLTVRLGTAWKEEPSAVLHAFLSVHFAWCPVSLNTNVLRAYSRLIHVVKLILRATQELVYQTPSHSLEGSAH